MTSLGEALRRERLKRNLELDWIAQELKIPVSMLNAIEEERFHAQLRAAIRPGARTE